MKSEIFNHFLTKQDTKLFTWKKYHHNFQWYNFESENCIFYVWHKKNIKLIDSKNLWSTINVFYFKENKSENITNTELNQWINIASQIFSAFDEDSGIFYNFLPYFQTKYIEEKNQIFEKLWLNIKLESSQKWIIINHEYNKKDTEELTLWESLWLIFWLTILYGKFEKKGDNLSSIKIQLPLFGQYLSFWENLQNIKDKLQFHWFFIQISENIQWEKHIFEITCNDYELLEIFLNYYNCVENFSKITKREQTQEAIEALKEFLEKEWELKISELVDYSCIKILQKI